MTSPLRRLHDADPEAGFDTIGTALIVPILLIVLAMSIAFARVAHATNSVEGAAWFAARAASLQRTPGQATAQAQATTSQQLAASGIPCTAHAAQVDTSGFATTVGTPAQVTVTVTCTVPLADLAVPGLPGTKTFQARAVSALDTFRERTS